MIRKPQHSLIWGMYHWNLLEDAHGWSMATVRKNHEGHLERSSTDAEGRISHLQTIPCGLLPKHSSNRLSSDMNERPLRAFFTCPKTWKSHSDKSRLYAGCFSTFHYVTFIFSWIMWATWGQVLSCSMMMHLVILPWCFISVLVCSF